MELALDFEEFGSGLFHALIHASERRGRTEEFCLGNSRSIPVWCYHFSDLPLLVDEPTGDARLRNLGKGGWGEITSAWMHGVGCLLDIPL